MAFAGKNLGIVIVLLVLVGAVAGVGGYYAAPKGLGTTDVQSAYNQGKIDGLYPNGTLKLGLLGPMTGNLASEGAAFVDGANWAVEEINALGGICGYKLQLVQGDTVDFEPARVTTLIQKMVNDDKVAAIFSGYGSQSLVEYDVTAENNMLYFIGADWQAQQAKVATNPTKYKTQFNIVSSYEPYRTDVPNTFDRWVREGTIQAINKKVAIVYSDNSYSSWIAEGLRDTFVSLGYEITLFEMVPFGTVTEWGPILAKIRADPPALIINTDYIPSNEAAFVQQFLEKPTKSHLFIQYGPSTPEFVDILADKATGILYNSPNIGAYTANNKLGEEVLQRAKDRFGRDPGGYTLTLYDELWIYKRGCEIAHAYYGADPAKPEDRTKIAEAIAKWTAYMGESGVDVFDSTHALDARYATPVIYQLWGGQRMTVNPAAYANAQIKMPPWWDSGTQ